MNWPICRFEKMNVDCVGFIAGNPNELFLASQVSTPERVSRWQFDRVLITDLEQVVTGGGQLVESGVP